MKYSTLISALLPLTAFILFAHLGWLPWMIVDRAEYEKQQVELTQRRQAKPQKAKPQKVVPEYRNPLETGDRPGTRPFGLDTSLDR